MAVKSQNVTGKTYYVSTSGADDAPGTKDAPFKTIERAVAAMKAGDTCRIRGGVYRESIRVETGGTADRPIRFCAADNETVVLTGTDPIAGTWERHDGDIWKTRVDVPFEQLFGDGEMLVEARWPKATSAQMLDRSCWASAEGQGHGWVKDSRLAEEGIDATGAVAWLNIAHQWHSWARGVTKHAAGSDTFEYEQDLPGLAAYATKEQWPTGKGDLAPRYFLFGKLEFLNRPGEWYLDRTNLTLYLIPPKGKRPEEVRLEGKRRALAFNVEGDHVQISGLNFFGATVRFGNCAEGLLEACHFLYPTFNRLFPDPGQRFRGDGAVSVTLMSGEGHTMRKCSVRRSPDAGLEILGPRGRIDDCLVDSICWHGSLNYGGIRVAPRPDHEESEGMAVISRCTVRNGGNALVDVERMPRNVVEYCHIHDGGKACKDVSLLYTQLPIIRGTIFRYNWVHGCHAPHIALGIRGDDQTRGLTIHHNVVWDCEWEGIVVKGDENRVYNNTCFRNAVCAGCGDIRIDSAPEPLKPFRQQWPLLETQNEHSETINNFGVIKASRKGWMEGAEPVGAVSNNLSGVDPKLVDIEGMDFRPASGSPLIGVGKQIPGITPGDDSPDIGAYQHDGERWVPGCSEDVENAAESFEKRSREML